MERRKSMIQGLNPYEQAFRLEALQQSMRRTSITIGSPFEMQEHYIEKISFLADSIILVVTRSSEFKLFYTQRFDYGNYTPKALFEKTKKEKGLSSLVDEGIHCVSMIQSLGGPIYD